MGSGFETMVGARMSKEERGLVENSKRQTRLFEQGGTIWSAMANHLAAEAERWLRKFLEENNEYDLRDLENILHGSVSTTVSYVSINEKLALRNPNPEK